MRHKQIVFLITLFTLSYLLRLLTPAPFSGEILTLRGPRGAGRGLAQGTSQGRARVFLPGTGRVFRQVPSLDRGLAFQPDMGHVSQQ